MNQASGLVCMRCEQVATPVQGSIKGACHWCKKPVWISKAGQRHQAEKTDVLVVCVICCSIRSVKVAGWAPGAIEEAAEHVRNRHNFN